MGLTLGVFLFSVSRFAVTGVVIVVVIVVYGQVGQRSWRILDRYRKVARQASRQAGRRVGKIVGIVGKAVVVAVVAVAVVVIVYCKGCEDRCVNSISR